MNTPRKMKHRLFIAAICCLVVVLNVSAVRAESHGTLVADDGWDIYDWELDILLTGFIGSYHSRILCFTECYGGDKMDDFAGDPGTTVLSGSTAGNTTDYGGYHRGLAGNLTPGSDTDTAHTAASGTASSGDSPTSSGPNQDIGTGGDGGNIQSCHVLVWGGDPNAQDQADINDIHSNFSGQPNTTVTVLAGDGTGANVDGAANFGNLVNSLSNIGSQMNANEQFILFVTDHGDLDASQSNVLCPVGVCQVTVNMAPSLYADMLADLENEPYLAIFTETNIPLTPGHVFVSVNEYGPFDLGLEVPWSGRDYTGDGVPEQLEYKLAVPEDVVQPGENTLLFAVTGPTGDPTIPQPIFMPFLSLDSGAISRLGSGSASVRTDIDLAGQTLISKSPMNFQVCYTNTSGGILGDDETLTGRLRTLLFANGKSAGDFSSLLGAIPVLGPGATWCDSFAATVPVTTKSKKVQKILRVPMRVEVAAIINGVLDPGSESYAAFRIEERDVNNDYWLIDNDEEHDIDLTDGFGGITHPVVEPGNPDSNVGNEGFWWLGMPNRAGDAIGTYLQGPPNAGADLTLSRVDISAAEFMANPTPAMVGVFHDAGGVRPFPDLSNPILGPTTFVPLAANSISGGDHAAWFLLPSPVSIAPLEPVWTVYFFGGGRSDGLGIDNPNGIDNGGGYVDFESTFFSINGFFSPATTYPMPGNWIVDYFVNDVAGAFPSGSPGPLDAYTGWKEAVLANQP